MELNIELDLSSIFVSTYKEKVIWLIIYDLYGSNQPYIQCVILNFKRFKKISFRKFEIVILAFFHCKLTRLFHIL